MPDPWVTVLSPKLSLNKSLIHLGVVLMIAFLDLHQGGLGNFIGQSLCASAGFHLEHYRPWCLRRSGPTFGVNTIMSREMFGSENGVPQYGYQRNRRVKSSFNDLIPRQSLGKRVLSRESHVSVWKTPSFDLSESFFFVYNYDILRLLLFTNWSLGFGSYCDYCFYTVC